MIVEKIVTDDVDDERQTQAETWGRRMQQKSHARRPNIPKMRILTGAAGGQGEHSPHNNDSMGKGLEKFAKNLSVQVLSGQRLSY